MKHWKVFSVLVTVGIFSSACGVRSIPQARNAVDAAWAEVTNQYKRRADLVPNLVQVVKGYASHEKETLTQVTQARAQATQMRIDPSQATPEQVQKFMSAQGGLSQALGRLMVVAERYPDLKANENFRDLQVQLEGTENRITVARKRYIESVQSFNNLVTVPPESWTNALFYKHKPLPQFEVAEEERAVIEKAPEVKFE